MLLGGIIRYALGNAAFAIGEVDRDRKKQYSLQLNL